MSQTQDPAVLPDKGRSIEWFVYVLINSKNITYTGITKEISARLSKHNAGAGAKFTKGRGPWRVVYAQGPLSHGEALRQEAVIKDNASFKNSLKQAPPFYLESSQLPADKGAYVVLINLNHSLPVRLQRQDPVVLPPGRYLYCGSANGPGGIKARVSRHLRPEKSIRWHIDQLTTAGTPLGAWVVPGGNECNLAAQLFALPIPIPGFGSSDCRTCTSHLFYWPNDTALPLFDANSEQN